MIRTLREGYFQQAPSHRFGGKLKVCSIAQIWFGIQRSVRTSHEEATMAPHSEDRDWMSISEQASKEMDSAKLTALVEQLCSAVDNRKKVALSFPSQTNSQASS